jgi:hypothetical protein
LCPAGSWDWVVGHALSSRVVALLAVRDRSLCGNVCHDPITSSEFHAISQASGCRPRFRRKCRKRQTLAAMILEPNDIKLTLTKRIPPIGWDGFVKLVFLARHFCHGGVRSCQTASYAGTAARLALPPRVLCDILCTRAEGRPFGD